MPSRTTSGTPTWPARSALWHAAGAPSGAAVRVPWTFLVSDRSDSATTWSYSTLFSANVVTDGSNRSTQPRRASPSGAPSSSTKACSRTASRTRSRKPEGRSLAETAAVRAARHQTHESSGSAGKGRHVLPDRQGAAGGKGLRRTRGRAAVQGARDRDRRRAAHRAAQARAADRGRTPRCSPARPRRPLPKRGAAWQTASGQCMVGLTATTAGPRITSPKIPFEVERSRRAPVRGARAARPAAHHRGPPVPSVLPGPHQRGLGDHKAESFFSDGAMAAK